MHEAPKNYSEYRTQLDSALQDDFLRKTLDNFAVSYRENREAVFRDVDEKGLIKKVSAAKDAAAKQLDKLYAQFKEQAEKRGVHVHLAKDAAEACAIVAQIAKDNNVKTVVKSKSMTAEEIQLNPVLEKEGLIVDETDLGEWIIQLRHEGPSHMVMPAIHLSRYQVAEDFEKATGEKQDTDVQRLVKVARVQLRRKFINADMGISGCNFAIADMGAVSTVTNEGNARMVTTLPRVHVAIAGIDKLVPSITDVLPALQVLPRNATAQRLTSYVSLICGTGPCAANEDNQKIRHVVFVDNGRSEIVKDPLFSQIFRCVRCGACANVCPVFRLVGGHKMGYIYIGAIGLILTYFFHGHDKAKVLCQNCVGCEACANVCAGGIDLPRLICEIRNRLNNENGSGLPMALLSSVMKNRKMFHSLLKFARFAQRPFTAGTQFQRHLPAMFFERHSFKALPAIADKSFRDMWPELAPSVANGNIKVGLFAGCAQDFVYPEQLAACIKLFAKKGVAVSFPEEQTCCGLPLKMLAQADAAKEVARQNIDAFNAGDQQYIITLCASCASHMKHAYVQMLEGTDHEQKARDFAAKIIDYSSFVHDVLKLDLGSLNKIAEKVTYHSSCHLCRGLGVTSQPREIIAAAAEYVPSKEEDVCCGFGGSYSAKFPEISAQILGNKLGNIKESGASRIVMDCPGCIMQIRGGIEKNGLAVKAQHISELVAEAIDK